MVFSLFSLNLLLAFIIGSIWITLTTILAEKFGSKIGGFIGGLPSTVIITFLFIAINQTAEVASQATDVFPYAYSGTAVFMVIYALLAKRGFIVSLSVSTICWFFISMLIVKFNLSNFQLGLLIYGIVLVFSLYILEWKLKLPSTRSSAVKYTSKQILLRSFLSGLVIAFAVFMSKTGGSIFGGIFSSFPAIFISTLTITYFSKGIEFSRAMTKPLLITGMITNLVYVISIRYFYSNNTLAFGTLISFCIALTSAYFTFQFIQKRLL